jgi:general secretion pathway protein I
MRKTRTAFPSSAWERGKKNAACPAVRFRAVGVPAEGGTPAAARSRRGLSLFEIIIALAIFMGSIAAIGQLVSTGVRGAVQARLQSQAVLRAETKMAEVVSGSLSLHGSSSGGFPDDPSWTWSVTVAPSQHAGLYYVEVTAAHSAGTATGRQSFSLRRLMRDPQMALDAYYAQQEAAANGSGTGGSSTGTGSGTSGGSGTSSGGSK